QNALGQLVRMLHLVDRLVVLVLGEFLQPPVLQHLGVQEVLVDRDQFVVQRLVEVLDDLGVALHGLRLLRWGCPDPSPAAETMAERESKSFVGAALAPRSQVRRPRKAPAGPARAAPAPRRGSAGPGPGTTRRWRRSRCAWSARAGCRSRPPPPRGSRGR